MGKNTPERQDFIIDNLKIEKDLIDLPGGRPGHSPRRRPVDEPWVVSRRQHGTPGW